MIFFRFKDRIKEASDSLQKTVIQKNNLKLQDVEKFVTVLRQRERESENETIEILREFEHDKKIVDLSLKKKVPILCFLDIKIDGSSKTQLERKNDRFE